MHKLQILDVQPSLLPSTKSKIWLSIVGSGFSQESQVTVKVSQETLRVPKSRTKIISPELIQVCLILSKNEECLEVEVTSKNRKFKLKLK